MTQEQSEWLFGEILDGHVPDMELGAILLSMRVKGEDIIEVAGFKRAMDARTLQLDVPPGPRCVVIPTYNGARKQANLMPLVALLLAQRDVPVLIHGRHDFDSRVSLVPRGAGDGYPDALGPLLRAVARERRKLHVYVLSWDFVFVYAGNREWVPLYKLGWRTRPAPRIRFRLDANLKPVSAK